MLMYSYLILVVAMVVVVMVVVVVRRLWWRKEVSENSDEIPLYGSYSPAQFDSVP